MKSVGTEKQATTKLLYAKRHIGNVPLGIVACASRAYQRRSTRGLIVVGKKKTGRQKGNVGKLEDWKHPSG